MEWKNEWIQVERLRAPINEVLSESAELGALAEGLGFDLISVDS